MRAESGVAGGLGPAEPAPGHRAEARDGRAGGDHRRDAGAAGGARQLRRLRADVRGGHVERAARRVFGRAATSRLSGASAQPHLPAARAQREARPLRAARVRRRPPGHQQTLLRRQLSARLHAAGVLYSIAPIGPQREETTNTVHKYICITVYILFCIYSILRIRVYSCKGTIYFSSAIDYDLRLRYTYTRISTRTGLYLLCSSQTRAPSI